MRRYLMESKWWKRIKEPDMPMDKRFTRGGRTNKEEERIEDHNTWGDIHHFIADGVLTRDETPHWHRPYHRQAGDMHYRVSDGIINGEDPKQVRRLSKIAKLMSKYIRNLPKTPKPSGTLPPHPNQLLLPHKQRRLNKPRKD